MTNQFGSRQPSQTNLTDRWLVVLTILLFGAFLFRLWNLGTQSLWHDEAWSVFSAYEPFRPLDPNYPPYFTVLLGGWIRLVGDSVWAMRYFSALFGVIMVAATALITRRWFGKSTAIIAVIFVAASPTLWVYSQEIRSYTAMPLLTLILLALTDRLLRPQIGIPRRTWLWILLVEIVTLYVHNLSVPLIAWLNVTVITVWLFRREWRRIATWIIAQVGLLILYLPWLITQRPTGTALNTPPKVNLSLFWDIWQSYFTGIKALIDADQTLALLLLFFAGLTLASLIFVLLGQRSRRTFLLLSQVILLPTFELIIILVAHIDFHPRYFLLGIPATLIVVAIGASPIVTQWTGDLSLRVISPLPAIIACISALLITGRMATVLYSNPGYQHDDFRAIATHYAQLSADDAIIIPYGWEPTLDYYNQHIHFKAKVIGIPLHADPTTIASQLQSALTGVQRVEVLTWYELPADVRGAYPCLLGTDRVLQNTLTYTGIKTDGYVLADSSGNNSSVLNVDSQNQQANLGTMQLIGMETWSGTAGACVITHWQQTQPTADQWAIAARALNPLGWEIARTDSAVLNDNQVPTSLWKPNGTGTAFSALKLPEGVVPEVNYPLRLTVYSDQTPRGLDVLQNGRVLGKDVQVGSVTHIPIANLTVQPHSGDDSALGDGQYIHSNTRPTGPFQPGQEVRLTLEWWRTQWKSTPETITVTLTGNTWQIDSPAMLYPESQVLTWHSLIIPATASGHAVLSVTAPNGHSLRLGEYDVLKVDHAFTPPDIPVALNADFTGVGTLVGVNAPTVYHHGDPFNVTLIWKADATASMAYTVFVHLLDSNGRVIAQSDAQPTRATTSWVTGEYITDSHDLTFNDNRYIGQATLEVGIYDATTGDRVKLIDGTDHMALPISVDVR